MTVVEEEKEMGRLVPPVRDASAMKYSQPLCNRTCCPLLVPNQSTGVDDTAHRLTQL